MLGGDLATQNTSHASMHIGTCVMSVSMQSKRNQTTTHSTAFACYYPVECSGPTYMGGGGLRRLKVILVSHNVDSTGLTFLSA